jgi:hypothetical protein
MIAAWLFFIPFGDLDFFIYLQGCLLYILVVKNSLSCRWETHSAFYFRHPSQTRRTSVEEDRGLNPRISIAALYGRLVDQRITVTDEDMGTGGMWALPDPVCWGK